MARKRNDWTALIRATIRELERMSRLKDEWRKPPAAGSGSLKAPAVYKGGVHTIATTE